MTRELKPYEKAIASSKERFVELWDDRAYQAESVFAMQALTKNDYAFKVANNDPASVRNAMINAASTGLTLNPANGYAYLVPRDNKIVLDISYKGLIKIATDAGAVEWARADVVYDTDEFVYRGAAQAPEINRKNPFAKERGEVVGAYCIAKTSGGDILTEIMDLEEIHKIRSKSTAFIKGDKGKKGPWEEWFEMMCRKAVIKRAAKTWPYSSRMDKLLESIELANDAEGGYDLEGESVRLVSAEQAATIREWLESPDVNADELFKLFDIEAVEQLPASRYQEFIDTVKERDETA
jgi:recombination protein RecT